MTIGQCKHGVFTLEDGCAQCIAERRATGIRPEQDEMEDGPNTEGYTLAGAEKQERDDRTAKGFEVIEETPYGDMAEKSTYLNESDPNAWRTGEEEVRIESPETAVGLRPGEDSEAHGYHLEAIKFLECAESRSIATVEDLKQANDDLNAISKLKKAMEAKRKALLDPIKAQADAIRGTYDYLMIPIFNADNLTRVQILDYDAKQRAIRAEQERINRLKQEAAEAEAKLNGKPSEPVELVEVAPEPAKSVATDMGSSGTVDHWRYEVTDFALLPDTYKLADAALLNSTAKKYHDQKQIPGVRFYNEPYIASRPR